MFVAWAPLTWVWSVEATVWSKPDNYPGDYIIRNKAGQVDMP
jgi:hypothetical protein